MEPPRKRQRLLESAPEPNQSDKQLESWVAYENHDDEDEDELLNYGVSDMVSYDFRNENGDFDLAERRARVDQKLKSKWEMLFEKFSKDFTGIGDEIDLATGEIVVDNGHLKSMQNEGDIGSSVSSRSLLRALTVEPEGLSDIISLSEGQDRFSSGSTSQDGDVDVEEDTVRPSTEIQQEEHSGASRDVHVQRRDVCDRVEVMENLAAPPGKEQHLPSREEILERFGELGPKIIQLLDQQQENPGQDNIEPAWRVPELPSRASGKRLVLQSALLQEADDERSPSPEQGISLWATPNGLLQHISQRPILDAVNNAGRRGSESIFGFEMQRRGRAQFTELDDEILFKEVTKAKKLGFRIDSKKVYSDIAVAYPHHSGEEWYRRWYKTRRLPGIDNAISLGATPEEIKDWKFDGLEWISKTPAHHTVNSSSHAPRTVEYVKRVIRTHQPRTGDYQDVHTFVGVIISETDSQKTKSLKSLPNRFQELSSRQLRSAESQHNEHDDFVSRSPFRLAGTPRIPAERPHWQISWNDDDKHIESVDTLQQARAFSASEDLFDKLKSLLARPVRTKKLSSLKLVPGEQSVSINEGGHECHVRLIPCPHRDCRKSSKLYRTARITKDNKTCELTTHLRDEHNFSMYPCLEKGCKRKGGNGFRHAGKLILHVKVAHNDTRAWMRLQKIIDQKSLASNGIHFDERIANIAPAADALDELQDDTSGLGIQLRRIGNQDSLPQDQVLEDSVNEPMLVDDEPTEPIEPAKSTYSSNHLPEDSLVTLRILQSLGNDEDTTVTAEPQIAVDGLSTSPDTIGELELDIPALPSDLVSSSHTSVPLSSPRDKEEISAIDSCSSPPAINSSSPIQRYFLRNSTTDFSLRPNSNDALKLQLSGPPDESTAGSASIADPLTCRPESSPKESLVHASQRSLPIEIDDLDDLDELSNLSPSLTPSLMSCRSIITSRTLSQVSPLSNPPFPSLTSHKKQSARYPRHSLPMSAIPLRSVPTTSRKSLSGYNYKAPSSSMRNMVMLSTPTKNRKGDRNSGNRGNEVDEVLKTPGGTFRRCGREGFVCGRDFCFRCVRDGK